MSSNPYLAALSAHAKQQNMTPGQQATLLLTYVSLSTLLPEVTFERFLERTAALAGATEENLQSPKAALDHYCPTKGSAWPPKDRIAIMADYLHLNDTLRSINELPLMFNEYLAQEASQFRARTAQAATVTTPAPVVTAMTEPALSPVTPPQAAPPPVAVQPPQAAPPEAAPAPAEEAVPELTAVMAIPAADHALMLGLLMAMSPFETYNGEAIALGFVFHSQLCPLPDVGTIVASVVNATPRPYLDIYMVEDPNRQDSGLLAEIVPPIHGQLDGNYILDVPSRGQRCLLTITSQA
jgi:hypothetical protein